MKNIINGLAKLTHATETAQRAYEARIEDLPIECRWSPEQRAGVDRLAAEWEAAQDRLEEATRRCLRRDEPIARY